MLWIILGMVGMLAGIVVMVLGQVLIGLILLAAGVACMALNYATMMRGRGDDPDQAIYNGLAGQGKQQSEVVKANMPETGEQNPNVWEKLEQ